MDTSSCAQSRCPAAGRRGARRRAWRARRPRSSSPCAWPRPASTMRRATLAGPWPPSPSRSRSRSARATTTRPARRVGCTQHPYQDYHMLRHGPYIVPGLPHMFARAGRVYSLGAVHELEHLRRGRAPGTRHGPGSGAGGVQPPACMGLGCGSGRSLLERQQPGVAFSLNPSTWWERPIYVRMRKDTPECTPNPPDADMW